MSDITVAALFVEDRGAYYGIKGVDPWPESRDARKYAGPHPVVAHPPCARWGRYANGAPLHPGRYEVGDDDGCFAWALASVMDWGGVLEHPADSRAWDRFGICRPPRGGGWVPAGFPPRAWTCCVEQGAYGHPARKRTWLLYVGVNRPPDLLWTSDAAHRIGDDPRSIKTGVCQRLSKRQRASTPVPFRDMLISLAVGATR